MATALHQFTRVDFCRFKAFRNFGLNLRQFNILVGPNNSGKSTILTAFRILAAGLRKANTRRPETIRGPQGRTLGHSIDLRPISVAAENIFYNYNDDEVATIKFKLSNNNELVLFFPEQGACYLIPDAQGRSIATAAAFKTQFNCPIGFVPILGPVEHSERLFDKEAARLALFNYTASRNFRNIWYHYPERFDEFRSILTQTWPGMDIERPGLDRVDDKPLLHMFCPEERIPREIFWSGFGFQVWCQMLTHIIQSSNSSLFLIDEPDIYLHADLQRQLLGLLRNLGPDILIATHSTEIINEAEADDIVLINKNRTNARRIREPSDVRHVFAALGSNINPILTQLAKSRRAVFVEGHDFQILGKFAQKLQKRRVAHRSDFAVVSVGGFNPERIKNLKSGMETALGGPILAAALMDKDYRCDDERSLIIRQCKEFCTYTTVHGCKEIENFLLVPTAMDRAAGLRVTDRLRRGGQGKPYDGSAGAFLEEFAAKKKNYVSSQYIGERTRFQRSAGLSSATMAEAALRELEACWQNQQDRYQILPGKDALSAFNQYLQVNFGISITPIGIIDAMTPDEIPDGIHAILEELNRFAVAII